MNSRTTLLDAADRFRQSYKLHVRLDDEPTNMRRLYFVSMVRATTDLHEAICLLLRTRRTDGPAITLIRSFIDGCARAIWATFLAKERQWRKVIADSRTAFPHNYFVAIDEYLGGNQIFRAADGLEDLLSSFVHVGTRSLLNRMKNVTALREELLHDVFETIVWNCSFYLAILFHENCLLSGLTEQESQQPLDSLLEVLAPECVKGRQLLHFIQQQIRVSVLQ